MCIRDSLQAALAALRPGARGRRRRGPQRRLAGRAGARRALDRLLARSPAQGRGTGEAARRGAPILARGCPRLGLSGGDVRCGGGDLHAVQHAGRAEHEMGRDAPRAQAGRAPDPPGVHAQATAIRHRRTEGAREPLYAADARGRLPRSPRPDHRRGGGRDARGQLPRRHVGRHQPDRAQIREFETAKAAVSGSGRRKSSSAVFLVALPEAPPAGAWRPTPLRRPTAPAADRWPGGTGSKAGCRERRHKTGTWRRRSRWSARAWGVAVPAAEKPPPRSSPQGRLPPTRQP